MVEGWEPNSGQVRVQVRATGESVRVWPCEVVRMKEQPASLVNERKRRTMAGPIATTDSGARGDRKRARLEDVYAVTGEQMVWLRRRKIRVTKVRP